MWEGVTFSQDNLTLGKEDAHRDLSHDVQLKNPSVGIGTSQTQLTTFYQTQKEN